MNLKIPYTGILEREEKPQFNTNAYNHEIFKLWNELHKYNIPLKTNRLKSFHAKNKTYLNRSQFQTAIWNNEKYILLFQHLAIGVAQFFSFLLEICKTGN